MEEKLLSNRKNGMPVLLLVLVLYVAAVLGCVAGASMTEGRGVWRCGPSGGVHRLAGAGLDLAVRPEGA